MPTLVGHRVNMREHNLSDTERDPALLKPLGGASPRDQRAADGSYNDLGCPGWAWPARASAATCRLPTRSANSRPTSTSPIRAAISRELLARRDLRAGAAPQRSRPGLAAVHGARLAQPWRRRHRQPPHRMPLPPGDDWPARRHDHPAHAAGPTGIRRRTRAGPQPTATPRRIGGTARRSTARISRRQRAVRTRSRDRRKCCPDGKLHLETAGHLHRSTAASRSRTTSSPA